VLLLHENHDMGVKSNQAVAASLVARGEQKVGLTGIAANDKAGRRLLPMTKRRAAAMTVPHQRTTTAAIQHGVLQ